MCASGSAYQPGKRGLPVYVPFSFEGCCDDGGQLLPPPMMGWIVFVVVG